MTEPSASLPIQTELIDDTKSLAKELGVSWNQLVTLALQEFVQRYRKQQNLVERINAACADELEPEEANLLQAMRSNHRRIVEGEW
ncbi:MAG: hypothetical protein DCF21_12940 [Leptolyngbya sp.]|jgi:ribosomal protein L17|uniref:CopG family transcriptional regulator n=1 Tax=Shackletoniella antarctica TaxID=268115 RepID=A0A2W4WJS1_9CYAN|nr:MAG: hypothetical protein DCF17_03510 [Shackletoniella antarctica]PZV14394.1 MAG: hypothetical protein DCF21_12940 [Leptolyngbya sp.]